MKNTKKPFELLTRRKVTVGSAIAAAALIQTTSAVALDKARSAEIGNQPSEKANVSICHKGKDMQVSIAGLIGHMVHGDSLGSCGGDGGGGRGGL